MAITSLLLPNVNQVHWVATALWLVSVLSAFTSVYFACRRTVIIGRIWCGKDFIWLRRKETKTVYFPKPRSAVLILFSLCTWFLKIAVITYVIGLGVYLGSMWRNNPDSGAEHVGNRNIFIVFLVYAAFCVILYLLVKSIPDDRCFCDSCNQYGEVPEGRRDCKDGKVDENGKVKEGEKGFENDYVEENGNHKVWTQWSAFYNDYKLDKMPKARCQTKQGIV